MNAERLHSLRERVAGHAHRRCPSSRVTRNAGVVTSAALVMVGVFSLFVTATELELKQAADGPGCSLSR